MTVTGGDAARLTRAYTIYGTSKMKDRGGQNLKIHPILMPGSEIVLPVNDCRNLAPELIAPQFCS